MIAMPPLSPSHAEALALALDVVFEHSDPVLGVVFSGSVARGSADQLSDIDLFVLVDGSRRQGVQRRLAGVACEMFFNPPARIPRYLVEEAASGRCPTIGLLLDGVVLYDPSGVVAQLRAAAEQVRGEGPKVSDEAMTLRRYVTADLLDNARDVEDRDPITASILAATAVRDAMVLSHVLADRWAPRDKDLLAGVAELRPETAVAIDRYGRDRTVASACDLVEALIGVSGFFEWESPPEHFGGVPEA